MKPGKPAKEKKIADQMAERFKSEAKATVEEYLQKLQSAQGEVNKMIADVDGELFVDLSGDRDIGVADEDVYGFDLVHRARDTPSAEYGGAGKEECKEVFPLHTIC